MVDPCFHEYFVLGADGFITSNLNKDKRLLNGTRIKYHSFVPATDDERSSLLLQVKNAVPGDVITLKSPPAAINVVLVDENSDLKSLASWNNFSLDQDRVVITIVPHQSYRGTGTGTDYTKTIVPGVLDSSGNILCRPSRLEIHPIFPLEPAFAMTVHKAQGRTMGKVILAISHKQTRMCNMNYASLYVALTRVRSPSDVRLLLTGPSLTLAYISNLRPDKSLHPYLAGYRQDPKHWDELAALNAMNSEV